MEVYRLGDLAEIGRGSSPRPITDELYFKNGNIPWIKIADATISGKYIYKTKEYVNDYGASFSRKLSPGSLIIAASGTLGFPKFLGVEGCIHDGWMYFSHFNEKIIDKDYLYYQLISLRRFFNNLSYGAAIQNINTPILKKTKIALPSLPVQRRIASILSAYDNLIENNNRRIRLLEQMAENLYKEWFVRFRFPGHEKVEMENGLPKGWTRGRLRDIVEFQNGFAFKSETFQEEGRYSIVTIKNVQDEGFDGSKTEKIDVIPSRMPSYCCLKEGDILLSLTGNVGRVCRVFGRNYLLNQRVAKIKAEFEYFIYSLMKTEAMFAALNTISYGTAQLNLSPIKAAQLKIIVPAKELQIAYNQKVSALFESIDKLKAQNQLLTRQRDLLLPRLMSGKLEVNA